MLKFLTTDIYRKQMIMMVILMMMTGGIGIGLGQQDYAECACVG